MTLGLAVSLALRLTLALGEALALALARGRAGDACPAAQHQSCHPEGRSAAAFPCAAPHLMSPVRFGDFAVCEAHCSWAVGLATHSPCGLGDRVVSVSRLGPVRTARIIASTSLGNTSGRQRQGTSQRVLVKPH